LTEDTPEPREEPRAPHWTTSYPIYIGGGFVLFFLYGLFFSVDAFFAPFYGLFGVLVGVGLKLIEFGVRHNQRRSGGLAMVFGIVLLILLVFLFSQRSWFLMRIFG